MLAAVLVCAGVLAGCGGSTAASSGVPGTRTSTTATIVLYNAQHEQTTDALIATFTRQTGIRVRVRTEDEDLITAQIEQEGSRSPADAVYTENSNWLQQLDDSGMLAKLSAVILDRVPARDSAPNGDWVGISARVSCLVYNPQKISASQLPKSVLDMADPRYKGKFELAPAETDFWPIVSSVARARGRAVALSWLKGLKANSSDDNVPDNETLVSDVNAGITDFALVNSYYLYRLQAEVGTKAMHAKLAYFAPHDPGYVEDISGAAVLRSSRHKAAASKFVAFLTGREGQHVLARSDSFEYPLHSGVAASRQLTPLANLTPAAFFPAQLGAALGAKALLQQAGLV